MRNRYREPVSPEELAEQEEEFDSMMAMTDEEIDAELDHAMQEWAETLDSMTPDQLYRTRRRIKLGHCISFRALSKEMAFAKTLHRQTQWACGNSGIIVERESGRVGIPNE